MNLWRAWAPSPDGRSRRVVWATSERECRKLAKNDFGDSVVDVKCLDLPTTKPALVEWLNDNVNNIVVQGEQ